MPLLAKEVIMEHLKRKLDQHRRGLEETILQMTIDRKQMMDARKYDRADKIGKSLEVIAVANHNLWLATIPLGQ